MKYFDLFLRSLFQLEHLESCLFSFHFLFHFSGLRSLPLPFLSLRFLPYQCLILRLFHRRLFLCHFFFGFFPFYFFFNFFLNFLPPLKPPHIFLHFFLFLFFLLFHFFGSYSV